MTQKEVLFSKGKNVIVFNLSTYYVLYNIHQKTHMPATNSWYEWDKADKLNNISKIKNC